jgi:SAM-dependent methyltransferase
MVHHAGVCGHPAGIGAANRERGAMNASQHWERVYRSRQPTEVSWSRPHLDLSLELILRVAPNAGAAILDVGGGESTLVDDLIERGYRNVTVLDLSPTALDVAKARLGARASLAAWQVGDVCDAALPAQGLDLWHDRAVFHFLTGAEERAAYVRQVSRAVRAGGHVIVATFGPDGPLQCSGLDVVRYDPESLHGEFGAQFRLMEHRTELHRTPMGRTQPFVYCYCRLVASGDAGAGGPGR